MDKDIITQSELKDKIEKFLLASQVVFKTDKPVTKQLAQIFSNDDLSKIDNVCSTMTANQLRDFFQNKADSLSKIPVVHITIGCYPTFSVIKKIHDWLSNKLNKQIVVDVTTDEFTNNQIIVQYQGKRNELII